MCAMSKRGRRRFSPLSPFSVFGETSMNRIASRFSQFRPRELRGRRSGGVVLKAEKGEDGRVSGVWILLGSGLKSYICYY